MKSFLSVILLAVICPLLSFAQSNYKPGYVVSLKGDTIKGFIDYKEWTENPKDVLFAVGVNAKAQKYTPQNSLAFGVNGLEYYEQHVVSVSTDATDVRLISIKTDSNTVIDTVFLKVLAKGRNLSFYAYTDHIKTRYYISEAGSNQLQELVYKAYYGPDQTTMEFNRRYRAQLNYESEKYNVKESDIEKMISRADYDRDDLAAIIYKINGATGEQFVSKSQFGTRWFAGAGVAINQMSFNGIIQYPSESNVSPKASVGIDLLTNKYTQQLVMRLELSFTGDQHSFSDSYQQSQLKVTQYTVSFAPQVYYNFYNGQKFKIFAGGGFLLNYSVYPTHYYISEQGIDLEPERANDYPEYHSFWITGLLKAGVLIDKKIELYAGYVPSTTLTEDYILFGGNVTSYQAGINYLFGSK